MVTAQANIDGQGRAQVVFVGDAMSVITLLDKLIDYLDGNFFSHFLINVASMKHAREVLKGAPQ
jgi:hypothetical protein